MLHLYALMGNYLDSPKSSKTFDLFYTISASVISRGIWNKTVRSRAVSTLSARVLDGSGEFVQSLGSRFRRRSKTLPTDKKMFILVN